jgi:hypothetical protein
MVEIPRHGTDDDAKPLPSFPSFCLPARPLQCRQEEYRSGLSRESLTRMTTMRDGEGIGMEPFSFAGKTLNGHSGGSTSSGAWLTYFPAE